MKVMVKNMANWINDPINSGYTVLNGTMTGSASSKLACWLEYKVISQSVENNTSAVRFYVYLATAQKTSSYWLYYNNYDQDKRGLTRVYAENTLIYTRTKRGFATAKIPSRDEHVTQYDTAYADAEGTKFLTVLTDNASSQAAAYGEFTVVHDADGTRRITLSFTADCSIAAAIGTVAGSTTFMLPTIPRSTVPSVGSITLGSNATITLSPASGSFTHTLRARFGSRNETTICSKSDLTSISWTPSLSEAYAAPNATTVAGKLYCDTYSGDTLIGTTSVSITAKIPETVKPTVSYSLAEAVSDIADKFKVYVQSKSKLKVTITPFGRYGSTISSVTTTVNGTTYTTNNFTTGELKNSGSQTMKITVKDSRNRTTTVNVPFTALAYSAPKLKGVSVFRCDAKGVSSDTGTYISVTLIGQITSLNQGNDATFTVGYKQKTASDYVVITLASTGYSISGTFVVGGDLSDQYAYDIRVGAADYFATTYVYSDISTADTILSIRGNGLGLAIGKISEKNKFEIGWSAEFNEAVEFKGDVNFENLKWLCDAVFPIGSIRMSVSDKDESSFLGGSWIRWGSGRVPVGVDASDTDFKAVEKTGGAKTVGLTTANLPSHTHSVSGSVTVNSGGEHTHIASKGAYTVGSGSGSNYKYMTNDGSSNGQSIESSGSHTHTATVSLTSGKTGSAAAHNNLPPYITCYFWKRIA